MEDLSKPQIIPKTEDFEEIYAKQDPPRNEDLSREWNTIILLPSKSSQGYAFRTTTPEQLEIAQFLLELPRVIANTTSNDVKESPIDESDEINHTPEVKSKGFPCEECGKFLATRSSLSNHRNTHTRERLYICKVCGDDFVDRSTQLRHEKNHQGLRQFSCPIEECGKRFTQKSNMERHYRTIHRF